MLKKYNILFIEQPVKSSKDHNIKTKLPLCADESFHLKNDKQKIKKIYQWVNIKPDKFGCESDILKSIQYAKKNKLKIFLGCMVSSSLSIIPSLKYTKYCNVLDLDGPLFLKKDYKNGLKYKNGYLIYNKKFNYGF
jgi:L-alanine-DL-glutamate epimerase-like enolase superfamily enzyme